jgi:excisionase family DNA binding protein
MPDEPTDLKLLTPKDVAEVLRLSMQTVYELLKTGQLPHYKVGRSYRVSEEQLADYLRGVRSDPEK